MIFEHRKAEMIELFYDLVFVYAVSQSSHWLHTLENGVIQPKCYFQYLVTFFLFISAWITETLFLNRYKKYSGRNNCILIIQMFLLLYLSNSATADWEDIFVLYSIVFILLEITNIFQYAMEYIGTSEQAEKRHIATYIGLILVFLIFLTVGIQFDPIIGSSINIVGLVLFTLLPVVFPKQINDSMVHFPHLIERFGLLVIILFGEIIISISGFFHLKEFDVISLPVFLSIVFMFLAYMNFFEEMLEDQRKTSGIRFRFSHLPLYLSLGTLTAVFHFLGDSEADSLFVAGLFFLCLWGYYLSIACNIPYLKAQYQFTGIHYAIGVFLLLAGTGVGLVEHTKVILVTMSGCMTTLGLFILIIYIKCFQSNDCQYKNDRKTIK